MRDAQQDMASCHKFGNAKDNYNYLIKIAMPTILCRRHRYFFCQSLPAVILSDGFILLETLGKYQRIERLIAEMIAFRELVVIDESMPTPQMICALASPPIWHSMYEAAIASVPAVIACSA